MVSIADGGSRGVVGGPFGSKLGRRDYVEGGVPVIRGVNLPTSSRFAEHDFVFVTEEKVREDLGGNLAQPGDIIVTQRGTIGQVGLIPRIGSRFERYVISQSQMRFRADLSRVSPEFVFYALRSPHTTRRLQDLAISAGVPHINLEMFRSFELDVPDLSCQRKIAAVLSAYDESIENNVRRIEILEEMAQAVYREWFVNFRYPGLEGVELVDSPLGPIPQGWRAGSFRDIAESKRRLFDPSKAQGELVDHYSFAAFDAGETPVREFADTMLSGKLLIEQPAILLAKLNPRIPRVWYARPTIERRAVASSEFLVLEGTGDASLEFVHAVCTYPDFQAQLTAMSGGTSTSHQRLKLEDLMNRPLVVPSGAAVHSYEEVSGPMHDLVANLTSQNANLRATRDLLLPRLVSGEIDVSDLDIDTDWLVA